MTTAPVAVTDPPRAARRRLLPSGGFGRFVLRRLVALVFLSLGITFVAFVLTELVPSNAEARISQGPVKLAKVKSPSASMCATGPLLFGPWNGARVAPQYCPILRPGRRR